MTPNEIKAYKNQIEPKVGEIIRAFYNPVEELYDLEMEISGTWTLVSKASSLNMKNTTFVVNHNLRRRTVREGKWYPHIYIQGILVAPEEITFNCTCPLHYNPYDVEAFVTLGQAIELLELGYGLRGYRTHSDNWVSWDYIDKVEQLRLNPKRLMAPERKLIPDDFKQNEDGSYTLAWDTRVQFYGLYMHSSLVSNNDFERFLVAQGILKEENRDSEYSCFYGNWKTLEEVLIFIEKFNAAVDFLPLELA